MQCLNLMIKKIKQSTIYNRISYLIIKTKLFREKQIFKDKNKT